MIEVTFDREAVKRCVLDTITRSEQPVSFETIRERCQVHNPPTFCDLLVCTHEVVESGQAVRLVEFDKAGYEVLMFSKP